MISVVHNWWITSFHQLLLSPSEKWGTSLVLGRGASRLCSHRAPGRWRIDPEVIAISCHDYHNGSTWEVLWDTAGVGALVSTERHERSGKEDQIPRGVGGEETARILTLRFIVFLFSFSMYNTMVDVWKNLWKFSNCQECWRRNRVMLELTW